MTDYLTIGRRKKLFIQLLEEKIREAEQQLKPKTASATCIQRIYRGSVCRYDISRKGFAVNEIQRCFRGHLGRQKAHAEMEKKQTLRQLHYIHYLCTQIQRCFRGYYSRKYKRDHSKRKLYCRMIAEKGREILQQMQHYAFLQSEREAQEEQNNREKEFKNLAQNLHHLLSTRHIRGVYNPLQNFIIQPTMKQKPVEEHIRGVVKDLLRTRGVTKRGLVEDINGTLRIPLKGQKCRLSLQASVPYDTIQKEQLREKLLHRILTREKGNFVAGGKTKIIDHSEKPLNVGEPYLDPWANPMLVKGVPSSQKELLESARSQKALFARAPERPYVTRVGGNRSTTLANDIFDVIAEAEETGGAVHRNLGTRTLRFGLSSSMDSRSATIQPEFVAATNIPDGFNNPNAPPRSSATLRSTQKRVKSYTAINLRTRPANQVKNSKVYAASRLPFDRISEDSSVLTMGSKSFDFAQAKNLHQPSDHRSNDSSDEEDDFRG